jgi:hypothetical protein
VRIDGRTAALRAAARFVFAGSHRVAEDNSCPLCRHSGIEPTPPGFVLLSLSFL